MLNECLEAAGALAESDISCEIIDLATLKPYDRDAVRRSVEKTGRCLIVHEAPLTGGFGAEIAADLADHCVWSLKAPVKRVTGFDTIMPYPKLEAKYLPTVDRIVRAAGELGAFS